MTASTYTAIVAADSSAGPPVPSGVAMVVGLATFAVIALIVILSLIESRRR